MIWVDRNGNKEIFILMKADQFQEEEKKRRKTWGKKSQRKKHLNVS